MLSFKIIDNIPPVFILFPGPVVFAVISIALLNSFFKTVTESFGLCIPFDALSFYRCVFI